MTTSRIELKKSTSNLNKLIATIDSSECGFKYIFRNNPLVRELQSYIKKTEEGTANFNLNMEALKHNFLTRGYYRKLEKQEKKEKASADKSCHSYKNPRFFYCAAPFQDRT